MMLKETPPGVNKNMYAKLRTKRKSAQLLGANIKASRRRFSKSKFKYYRRQHLMSLPSFLAEEKGWLLKRVPAINYDADLLFRELKNKGYQGSYEMFKLFVHPYSPLNTIT